MIACAKQARSTCAMGTKICSPGFAHHLSLQETKPDNLYAGSHTRTDPHTSTGWYKTALTHPESISVGLSFLVLIQEPVLQLC